MLHTRSLLMPARQVQAQADTLRVYSLHSLVCRRLLETESFNNPFGLYYIPIQTVICGIISVENLFYSFSSWKPGTWPSQLCFLHLPQMRAQDTRAQDTRLALISAPLSAVTCKSFAVSTDRRKDREMAIWKMRWRDKKIRGRELERKGSEEIEKEKNRMEGTGLPLCPAGNSNEGEHLLMAYLLSQQIP